MTRTRMVLTGSLIGLALGLLSNQVAQAAITSPYWAGYQATGQVFNSVTATWVQPTVTCASASEATFALVGLDSFDGTTPEQAGTRALCTQVGLPASTMLWTSAGSGIATKAGDKITATVSYVAPYFTLTARDRTSGKTLTASENCAGGQGGFTCPRTVAEVAAGGGSLFPLTTADYGKATLSSISMHTSHGKVGGFRSSYWTNTRINQGTHAKASALTSTGAFTDTWLS